MSIERTRDHVTGIDADGGAATAVDHVAGAVTDVNDVSESTAAAAVLALVGLDPVALLCTPDVVVGGRQ